MTDLTDQELADKLDPRVTDDCQDTDDLDPYYTVPTHILVAASDRLRRAPGADVAGLCKRLRDFAKYDYHGDDWERDKATCLAWQAADHLAALSAALAAMTEDRDATAAAARAVAIEEAAMVCDEYVAAASRDAGTIRNEQDPELSPENRGAMVRSTLARASGARHAAFKIRALLTAPTTPTR